MALLSNFCSLLLVTVLVSQAFSAKCPEQYRTEKPITYDAAGNLCARSVYLSIFTLNNYNDATDAKPYLTIELNGGTEIKTVRLYDLPGREFEMAKGDLWEFEVDDFGFSEPCVSTAAITNVAIEPDTSSGDGIYIKDAFTWVRSGAASEMLTADYDIVAWLDGDVPEYVVHLKKV